MRVGLATLRARHAAAAFLVVAAAASSAAAEDAPPRPRLEVQRRPGAERCGGELEIARAVADRLGYAPFDDDALERFRVVIAPRAGEIVARVERLDASGASRGARELGSTAPDCEELSASVALAIAIALDPARAVSPPEPAVAEPAPPPPVAVEAPRPSPVARPRRAPESSKPVASAGIDVHGAVGSAPAPTLGIGVRADVRFGRVELGIEGRGDLPASTRAARGGEVSGQPAFATISTCLDVGAFVGCALGSAGALFGSSSPSGARDATPFTGAGLRAAVDLRIGPKLTLRPYVEGEATLTPTRLVYAGREAWRAPPVFAYGGLAARLPLF